MSYANVMATIAVFVALGGTSYAVTQLPRNSVGTKQLRPNSVGRSEVRTNAVRSKHIDNRSIGLHDLSLAARLSLRGQQGPSDPQGPAGPSGVTLSAAVDSGGGVSRSLGGAAAAHESGTGVYDVRFSRDLSNCYAVATLASVSGGSVSEPQNGEIITATSGGSVFVRTRDSSGAPTDLPFHVIVVC